MELSTGARVEYVDLDAVAAWPRNPKRHDLPMLSASFDRFGFVAPVLVDETTGRLVAGHGRLDALRALRTKGQPAPARVRVEDGRWLIPVIRGIAFRDEREAEAYLLADNRAVELGGWDEAGLATMLHELAGAGSLEGVGYDRDDVDRMLRRLGRGEHGDGARAEVERAEQLAAEWQTAVGQLWEIPSRTSAGAHRLLCGDATKPDDVTRLMDGVTAALFATDPPYLVGYTGADRPADSGKDWREFYAEPADAAAFVRAVFSNATAALADDAAWYCWHAHKRTGLIEQIWAELGILSHEQIVWVKPLALHTFSMWPWQHEPCLMGWRRGHKPKHDGDNSHEFTSVWTCDWEGAARLSKPPHPTQKPVELFRRPIRKHTEPGDVVLELFAGSGSQFVAAEQTGRRCYGMEIAPHFVAVVLQRLREMGLEPRRCS